jgi:hypothetical protein
VKFEQTKLTDKGRERLREIALLKVRIPCAKALAGELNITPNYVRQIIHKFMLDIIDSERLLKVVAFPREPESEQPNESISPPEAPR